MQLPVAPIYTFGEIRVPPAKRWPPSVGRFIRLVTMSGKNDSKDEEGPLPTGWAMRKTKEGRVYYVNHLTKTTQWTRPTPDPATVVEEEKEEPVAEETHDLAHVFGSAGGIVLVKQGNLRSHVQKAATKTKTFLNNKNISSNALECITASMNEYECNIGIMLKHPSVVADTEAEEGVWQYKVFGHTGGMVLVKRGSLVQKTRKVFEEYAKWRSTELAPDQPVFVGSCSNQYHNWVLVMWRPKAGTGAADAADSAADSATA